jgi:enoyl-CoA hydratase/carnithine racemase
MNDRVTITHLEDGIADVRMVRTDKMNALDPAQFQALADTIEELHGAKGLRCVVLSGRGGPSVRASTSPACQVIPPVTGEEERRATGDLATRAFGDANLAQYVAWGWRKLEVPVIAAAHGVAFGGGFQILSGADVRFIHPDTRCAIMEMKWGLVPDMAGFPLWRGNARDDVIRELTYTNREFNGREAHAMGFATHVSETPLEDALALAKIIANKHPAAMRGAKTLCNAMAELSDADLLLLESTEQLKVIRTPNQMEAVMAEMQKRKPVFAE